MSELIFKTKQMGKMVNNRLLAGLVDKHYLFQVITWFSERTIENKTSNGGFPFPTLQPDKEESKRAKKYFRRTEVDAYVSAHNQRVNDIING